MESVYWRPFRQSLGLPEDGREVAGAGAGAGLTTVSAVASSSGRRSTTSGNQRWSAGGIGTASRVVGDEQEAVLNALLAAETMTGRGGVAAHALPADRLLDPLP
ncbi:MAG: hypothetical protein ACJ786_18315 [Catenulispora sp.]